MVGPPSPPGSPNLARHSDRLTRDWNPRSPSPTTIMFKSPNMLKFRIGGDTVFTPDGTPRPKVIREHLHGEGQLTEEAALRILKTATDIFAKEPNVIELPEPVNICGDIHGQFYDLLRLFQIGGPVKNKRYLFLGDYVDRGMFGIECVIYLWALKIAFPKRLFLLRGNHECRHLTEFFTFKRECEVKYSPEVYEACIASFNALPLACIVDDQFYCVHGGLSPQLHTIDDVQALDRFREPLTVGPLVDLLWSDPAKDFGDERSEGDFFYNPVRKCAYYFSHRATCEFLRHNNLLCVIRGHEAMADGYRMYKPSPLTNFPCLITVFSAPNYCDTYHNKAVLIAYDAGALNIKTFQETPHPFWLPDFQDGLTWSLPFAVNSVSNILMAILNLCTDDELDEEALKEEKMLMLKRKIEAVGKLSRYYNVLAEEKELVVKLKGLSDDRMLPRGILGGGKESLEYNLIKKQRKLLFKEALMFDAENDCLPSMRDENAHEIPVFRRFSTPARTNPSTRQQGSRDSTKSAPAYAGREGFHSAAEKVEATRTIKNLMDAWTEKTVSETTHSEELAKKVSAASGSRSGSPKPSPLQSKQHPPKSKEQKAAQAPEQSPRGRNYSVEQKGKRGSSTPADISPTPPQKARQTSAPAPDARQPDRRRSPADSSQPTEASASIDSPGGSDMKKKKFGGRLIPKAKDNSKK